MSIKLRPVDLVSGNSWQDTTEVLNDREAGLLGSEQLKTLFTPLEKLTSGTVDGKGAFDELVRAIKAHLKEEFDAQRITGAEYSQVYLGLISAAMQSSIQFLLNEQNVHQINAQVGLLRQQTVTELAQTDDNIPEGLGFNFIPDNPVDIPAVVCWQS